MITINGKEYRNLEEQVKYNTLLIAEHYNRDRVLADFGIHILGEIDAPPEDEGLVGYVYGDAYIVGTSEPRDVWVWTQANAQLGQPEDYWLNIGPIAIKGDKGDTGATGPQGPEGTASTWYAGNAIPAASSEYTEGDMYLVTTNTGAYAGMVFRYNGSTWVPQVSIVGPQGPQGVTGNPGPQGIQGEQGEPGPRGPAGKATNLRGRVNSIGSLLDIPANASNNNAGYLVPSVTEPNGYDIWVCLPNAAGTGYEWVNGGPYAGGTVITDGSGNAVDTVPFVQINNPIFYEHNITVDFWYGSEHYTFFYSNMSVNRGAYNFSASSNPTIGYVSPGIFQGDYWKSVTGLKDNDGVYQDLIIAVKRNNNTELQVMFHTGNGEGELATASITIPISEITDVNTKDKVYQVNYNA